MALDYIIGVIGGLVQKKLNSSIGFIGILRKATIIIVLIVAVLLDRLLNKGTWVFIMLVCYFYIAHEGISLLENANKIGIPIPKKLISKLRSWGPGVQVSLGAPKTLIKANLQKCNEACILISTHF